MAAGAGGQGQGPEAVREAVAGYVAAVHGAYAERARHLAPAVAGALALVRAGRFSVAAAAGGAGRDLHFVATPEPFAPPEDPEVAVPGEAGPISWVLRFFDPVVLPELGLVAAGDTEEVRRVLGVRAPLYHLVLQPGALLEPHAAVHAGTALANDHGAAARDFEALRRLADEREAPLVAELEGAAAAGLVRAQALLARAIAPDDPRVEAAAAAAPGPDPSRLRRALLAALRGPR